MPIQGSGESSDGKDRYLLLLSLILLVWNVCATAQCIVSVGFLPPIEGRGGPIASLPAVDNQIPLLSAQIPRSGPISIRQKYLLGKRIDINKAPLMEIMELPGISRKVAAAVVEERDRVGRFRCAEDLLAVKGIKEKRLQKILPFLSKMTNN